MGDFWQPTAEMFGSLFEKPKMSEKLLIKPPFKYIFDILTETTKATKFAAGLYNEEELNPNTYQQKEQKLLYLKKMVDLVQLITKKEVLMKPAKLIAGFEPENTNLFLQEVYKLATSGKDSAPYVKKINSNYESMSKIDTENKGSAPGSENKIEQPNPPSKQQSSNAPSNIEGKKKKPEIVEEERKKSQEKDENESLDKERKQKEAKMRELKEKKDAEAREREKEKKELEEQQAKLEFEKAKVIEKQKNSTIERPPSANRNKAPIVKEKATAEQKDIKPKNVPANVILDKKNSKNEEDDLIIKEAEINQAKSNLANLNSGDHGKFIQDTLNQQDKIISENEKPGPGKEESQIKLGRIGGAKNKKVDPSKNYYETGSGGNNAVKFDVEAIKKLIQSLCQNTNPLGKSLEFLYDDIESMNKENEYWRKQFLVSKQKHQNELKKTEEDLQPVQDKLLDIEEQIKDQKLKIQNLRAQIIRNTSTIHNLLYSVVSTK